MKLNNILFIILGIIIIIVLFNLLNIFNKSNLFKKTKEGFDYSYTHFNNDCPDYNIEFKSNKNLSKLECEKHCNKNKHCKGYSYNTDPNSNNPSCILKSQACERDCDAKEGSISFYKKNMGKNYDPSDKCQHEFSYKIFNHDCALWDEDSPGGHLNPDITLTDTNLRDCKDQCSSNKNCKGITYGWETNKGIKCILKTNNCKTPGVITNEKKLKFAEKYIPIPEISGKWFGQDISSGSIILKQHNLKVFGTYSNSHDKNKIDGEGTISHDYENIIWKWKNSNTMYGNLVIVDDKVTEINWTKSSTKWTRKESVKSKYKIPDGYEYNTGTCVTSKKLFNNSQNFSFISSSSSKNLGIKTNSECADACNKDKNCFAFQNILNEERSPCILFDEEIKEVDANGTLGSIDRINFSCYTKSKSKLSGSKIPKKNSNEKPIDELPVKSKQKNYIENHFKFYLNKAKSHYKHTLNNPLPNQNISPPPTPPTPIPTTFQPIPTMPGYKPGDLKPLNILPPKNPAILKNP